MTKIIVVSHVNAKIFISIDLNYKLTANYKNDELVFSSVSTFVNGKLHSTSITEKNKSDYSITKDGHLSKFFNDIYFSGAMLYWKEPQNVSTVYSEIDNIEKPIKKIEPSHYQLSESNNKRLSDYYYYDALLSEGL